MNTEAYHIQVLKDRLSLRKRKSSGYSLRAYARDLDLHPAALSEILRGSRELPLKYSNGVVDKLALTPKEKTLFLESLYRAKVHLDGIPLDFDESKYLLDESYFKIIAEWEHYAVLTLFDIKSFVCNIASVSDALGIDALRSEVVINNLLRAGLISKSDEDGSYVNTHAKVKTTEDVSSPALRQAHLETLDIGKNKMASVAVEQRDFSSICIAIDPDRVIEAKVIIREFRRKMESLFSSSEKKQVYQLAIQFYPITKNIKEGEK